MILNFLKNFNTLSLYVSQVAIELTMDINTGFLMPQVPLQFWDCKHM